MRMCGRAFVTWTSTERQECSRWVKTFAFKRKHMSCHESLNAAFAGLLLGSCCLTCWLCADEGVLFLRGNRSLLAPCLTARVCYAEHHMHSWISWVRLILGGKYGVLPPWCCNSIRRGTHAQIPVQRFSLTFETQHPQLNTLEVHTKLHI